MPRTRPGTDDARACLSWSRVHNVHEPFTSGTSLVSTSMREFSLALQVVLQCPSLVIYNPDGASFFQYNLTHILVNLKETSGGFDVEGDDVTSIPNAVRRRLAPFVRTYLLCISRQERTSIKLSRPFVCGTFNLGRPLGAQLPTTSTAVGRSRVYDPCARVLSPALRWPPNCR